MNDNDPIKRRNARKVIPKAEHYVHLLYFALVAISGPYHIAAGICFALGLLVLMIHAED